MLSNVMVTFHDQEIGFTEDSCTISLPKDWKGAADRRVRVILDDICLIVPESIVEATGELMVLRFIEALIEAGLIYPEDVQKALEHII